MICTACLETIDSSAAYCQYCGNKTVHIGETTKLHTELNLNASGIRYTVNGERNQSIYAARDFSYSAMLLCNFSLIDGIEHVIINNVVYRRVS